MKKGMSVMCGFHTVDNTAVCLRCGLHHAFTFLSESHPSRLRFRTHARTALLVYDTAWRSGHLGECAGTQTEIQNKTARRNSYSALHAPGPGACSVQSLLRRAILFWISACSKEIGQCDAVGKNESMMSVCTYDIHLHVILVSYLSAELHKMLLLF